MTHQVTLNPINATFRADGHETILEAALRHDLLCRMVAVPVAVVPAGRRLRRVLWTMVKPVKPH